MVTDGYERCRQSKLPSMPTRLRKFYHPDGSDKDLRRDTSYGKDRHWRMGSQVEIWRWDHFWMLLLLSSLLLLCGSRPSTHGVGMGFTTFGVNGVEMDFPRWLEPPLGSVRCQSVARYLISYMYVRDIIE
jgi:hypothetical protein